jgi:hypothetical protein
LLLKGDDVEDMHPAFAAEPSQAAAFHLLDFARMGSKLHTVVAPFVYDCWQHRCAVRAGTRPVYALPDIAACTEELARMRSVLAAVVALAPCPAARPVQGLGVGVGLGSVSGLVGTGAAVPRVAALAVGRAEGSPARAAHVSDPLVERGAYGNTAVAK